MLGIFSGSEPSRFSRHSGSRASLRTHVRRCVLRAPSLTGHSRPSRITRKSYRPRVSDRTMVPTWPPFCFAGFGTDRLRCQESMKIAHRGNPNSLGQRLQQPEHTLWPIKADPSHSNGAREHEKLQSWEKYFLLTPPFIEHGLHFSARRRAEKEDAMEGEFCYLCLRNGH